MKLHSIHAGMFKLDGGAMFGVVPKSMWNKLNSADENNMCSWAMRCLLIEDGNRLILIDNGMGNKQDSKFFGHYYLHGDYTLEKSLAESGFAKEDITDVFLTHLHFDHCGGSIVRNSTNTLFEPAFKNAVYWSHSKHWNWAVNPNPREKASFLKENILPIQESGQLKFFDVDNNLPDYFDAEIVSGHTESMMLPLIKYKQYNILYVADLFPSMAHIPLPFIMAYDTRPLLTLSEKEKILNNGVNNNTILFFEHDPLVECCNIVLTEKGIRPQDTFNLNIL
ncbi:MAG TPA: MBL fold metallo-hydrolase [Bacteroidia bacterium]|nr:MBL fold metallo-hydrolase [Bacteroidia bacterium]